MGEGGDIGALFAFHINHVISKSRRSSRNMGCGKDLVEGENVLVIKEIAKVRTNKSIAGRINRCVMTEIGESVRIFGKLLQRGNLGLIAVV